MSFSSKVKSLAIASMKTHNDDPHISSNGTSLCGYLEDVRYQALEDAFGLPVDTEGPAASYTDAEWTVWFKFQFADSEYALDDLDDETVLLSAAMGDRIGAHPPLILFDKNASVSNAGDGQPKVTHVSALAMGDLWTLTFEDADTFLVKAELLGPEEEPFQLGEGPFELAGGMITLELEAGPKPFAKGDVFRFEIMEASTVEVYAPVMLDRARKDEVTPPRELRVAGFFEAPWRQFGKIP